MSPSTITLIFLVFAIVSFIFEKIPLGLTATIVAIGLNLTGVLDVNTTFKGYVNSNVILCVGMFVVGQALFDTGMANKIGGVVTKFAKTEKILIVAIMIIVGVMSGFLSNTGTAAVLIPVVCGIADEANYSRSRLLMPLVFAAALGGNLSIIGAPGNLMGVNALQELGINTSFFMYAPIGIPMLIMGILYFVLIGYKLLPDAKVVTNGEELAEKNDFNNVPKWKQITSMVVLILVIFAMIFENQIGIAIQISACIGACILVLTGTISEKSALKSIDLKVVLLFGGSLALASALDSTGAGTLIADNIVGLLGANPNPIILLLVIFIVTCILTNFMSNTATTALMVPIAVSLANSLGADPRAVVIATVIAGSCAYATPLRHNSVQTFDEYNTKKNVGKGTPTVWWDIVPNSDTCEIYAYMAGGGCTLPGKAMVLMPGAGYEGITDFVLDQMTSYGLNACPPLLVGVGVGTSIETAALNSKKALMRPIGSHNDNENAAKMEQLLEDGINSIGLGPQGMGGKYSVMGVNIENTARHPSTIGVAVNVGCWSHRRGHIIVDRDLNVTCDTHSTWKFEA